MKTTSPITWINIKSWKCGKLEFREDLLVIEEPLQLKLQFGQGDNWQEKTLSVTMRTPGNDFELAIGFLLAEGIIKKQEDVDLIRYCKKVQENERGNVLIVKLSSFINFDPIEFERNFIINSSCGICGKSVIEAIKCEGDSVDFNDAVITVALLSQLDELLRKEQTVFRYTGGIHATALFNTDGEMLLVREDVGRHNAFDKMVGAALMEGVLPSKNLLAMLSGRVSFELVQKAVRARIPIVVAVGAPSSLAVSLAEEKGITLIGFLKKDSFNIYTGRRRVIIDSFQNEKDEI